MKNLPSEIRASGLSRIMNCLGYLSIENIIEGETNDASREGTACGELLSHMIAQRTEKPNVKPTAENGVIFDSDMWFYATETYRNILESAQGNAISTEIRIDWPTTSGITIRGQYDISFVVGQTLHIEDLKYGWRIVDVEKNWQLLKFSWIPKGRTSQKLLNSYNSMPYPTFRALWNTLYSRVYAPRNGQMTLKTS
jgi:hypothetical protein